MTDDHAHRNRGQFRKGQSGNPGGRPRRAQALPASAFDILFDKTLAVARDGVTRQMSVTEALQHQTYREALAGKRLAIREVLRWIVKRDKWLASRSPVLPARVIFKPQDPDPVNADEALLLLSIACHNPRRSHAEADRPQLLLEPWAARAALRRRLGARPLTQMEVHEIRRCTREGHQLKLPEGARD